MSPDTALAMLPQSCAPHTSPPCPSTYLRWRRQVLDLCNLAMLTETFRGLFTHPNSPARRDQNTSPGLQVWNPVSAFRGPQLPKLLIFSKQREDCSSVFFSHLCVMWRKMGLSYKCSSHYSQRGTPASRSKYTSPTAFACYPGSHLLQVNNYSRLLLKRQHRLLFSATEN